MTTTDYILNAALVLLVVRQMKERRLDLRSALIPLVIVAIVGKNYLHTFPTAGNDLVLIGGLAAVGTTLGVISALVTHVRDGGEQGALSRAGWLAAGLWVLGIGARMGFAFATSHGFGPTVAHFSAVNGITGAAAWTDALVLMALCEVVSRILTLQLRGYRVTHNDAAPSLAPAVA